MSLWEQFIYTFKPPARHNYHGLSNQGATCYLNSVLQVLFMTRDFREAVERLACEDTETLDLHLKTLFDDLQSHTASTYNIIKKLGIDRVSEERDAAEYLEKILTLTSPQASQIFHGQLTHKHTCLNCGTESRTDAPVWHLPLALIDSCADYQVVDSIKDYFGDSHFSGLDQMYCEQCDDKVDVNFKCEMKHHPEVLVLLLKRFKFDYRYRSYVKNNHFVNVPYTLHIPENQTYELYACVDHVGDIRGGHYTATIKSQDDERWFNFHDTSVTLLPYQPFQVDNNEKSQTAYLLFYRKQKTTDPCSANTNEGSLSATSDNDDQSQEDEEILNNQECKEKSEVAHEIVKIISVDRHEETSDLCQKVNNQNSEVNVRQSEAHNHQEGEEGMKDDYLQHNDKHHKYEGPKEADGKETLPQITQLEVKEEDQHNVISELDDINLNYVHQPLNRPDEPGDAQKRVVDVKTFKHGQNGGDGQLENTWTENLNRNPKLDVLGSWKEKRRADERENVASMVHCEEGGKNPHDKNLASNRLDFVGEEQRKNEDVLIFMIKKNRKQCLDKNQEQKLQNTAGRYFGQDVKGQSDVREQKKLQQDGNIICDESDLESEKQTKQRLTREQVRKPENTQSDPQSTSCCVMGDKMQTNVCLNQKHNRFNDFFILRNTKKTRTKTLKGISLGNKMEKSQRRRDVSDPSTATLIKGVSRLKICRNKKKSKMHKRTETLKRNLIWQQEGKDLMFVIQAQKLW